MGYPSAKEVKVATDALRTESQVWDQQSDQMSKVGTTAKNMQLGRIEAGVFQLIVGPYNDVVNTVSSRSDEAVTAMHDIGNALRTVATTYDAEDAAAEHRNRGIY
ncbi:uncharacterized protein YukE [Hamadaea flava]|uniref:Excreted virulence factor EspC (Type VII ESX diderm) n=1 Tax=Hamadaea flava TaxID=1742688 RepID=A0ABV8LYI3_9ACTN|nr:hypothetical protein [Hamadaea flava]MCP2322177.1 uncharacterized protein YukE [Hamadaea flava]